MVTFNEKEKLIPPFDILNGLNHFAYLSRSWRLLACPGGSLKWLAGNFRAV